jgi:cephalosporin hydroxylase
MRSLQLKKFAMLQFRNVYNPALKLARALRRSRRASRRFCEPGPCTTPRTGSGVTPSGMAELDEIRARALTSSDISDHLETLFLEALRARPRLMVELGVREGESTFALERAAKLLDCPLLSVDIEPCQVRSSYPKWSFIQMDDLALAREFTTLTRSRGLPDKIDFLFLDTSHEFEHTRAEIAAYFPLLSPQATVIFHDTNLREFYFTRDGTLRFGWDNQRGVIRALEAYFGKRFDETKDFLEVSQGPPNDRRGSPAAAGGWLIRHTARSTGLTILTRQP